MGAVLGILVGLAVAGLALAAASIRVIPQYERGIVFRFGRVRGAPRGPGLTFAQARDGLPRLAQAVSRRIGLRPAKAAP